MASKTEAPTPTAPRRVTDFASVKEAEDRVADLHRQLTAAVEEERLAWQELTTRKEQSAGQSAAELAAGALADGTSFDLAQMQGAKAALDARVQAAQDRVVLLKRACQIARERKERAVNEASAQIAPTFRAPHIALLRDIVLAAVQLARTARAEQQFRDDIEGRGFVGSLHVRPLWMTLPDFGWPDTPNDMLWQLLKEATQRGIISDDEWAQIRAEWQNARARVAA